MKKEFGLCLLILFLLVTACSDQTLDGSEDQISEAGENFTFIRSSSLAEETGQNRSPEISDSFEIENVTIKKENGHQIMYIDLVQARGCSETYPEKFEVIWNGIMLMIYPPQVNFYLTFDNSKCPALQEQVEENVVLNLDEIFEGHQFEEAEFTVINASKSSEENDHEIKR